MEPAHNREAADKNPVPWTKQSRPSACFQIPTCTLAKSLAFAMILHPRLGNMPFGKVQACEEEMSSTADSATADSATANKGRTGFAGKELPVEVAITIIEAAMGTQMLLSFDNDSCAAYRGMVRLVWRFGKNRQRISLPEQSGKDQSGTKVPPIRYWNVNFVAPTAPSDDRILSSSKLSPSLDWLFRFMDTDSMPVPTVFSIPRFQKKIAGQRKDVNPLRPAFAGCPKAMLVLDTAMYVRGKYTSVKRKMQDWWNMHAELFHYSRRYYLKGYANSLAGNFLVCHVHNPLPVNLTGLTNLITLHRPVSAETVRHWLVCIWGKSNVDIYVRVRERKEGVQIFIFGPKVVPLIQEIMEAEVFSTWNTYYPTRTFLPL